MPTDHQKVLPETLSRRGLFRALGGARQPDPVRPPWSLPETAFRNACTGCGDCVRACPQGILKAVSGLPEATFAEDGCDGCGECAAACRTGALAPASQAFWRHGIVIGAGCLSAKGVVCRICAEQCDDAAITIRLAVGGRASPVLNTAACTGCGSCVGPCPAGAISIIPA